MAVFLICWIICHSRLISYISYLSPGVTVSPKSLDGAVRCGEGYSAAAACVHCCCSSCCTHFLACRLSRLSNVRLLENRRTKVRQAPLSMGFSRQEYWSELPCPPPGDLPDPGIKPTSLMSPFTSLICSYKNIFHIFMQKRKVHSLGTENKRNGYWHIDQRK